MSSLTNLQHASLKGNVSQGLHWGGCHRFFVFLSTVDSSIVTLLQVISNIQQIDKNMWPFEFLPNHMRAYPWGLTNMLNGFSFFENLKNSYSEYADKWFIYTELLFTVFYNLFPIPPLTHTHTHLTYMMASCQVGCWPDTQEHFGFQCLPLSHRWL